MTTGEMKLLLLGIAFTAYIFFLVCILIRRFQKYYDAAVECNRHQQKVYADYEKAIRCKHKEVNKFGVCLDCGREEKK